MAGPVGLAWGASLGLGGAGGIVAVHASQNGGLSGATVREAVELDTLADARKDGETSEVVAPEMTFEWASEDAGAAATDACGGHRQCVKTFEIE